MQTRPEGDGRRGHHNRRVDIYRDSSKFQVQSQFHSLPDFQNAFENVKLKGTLILDYFTEACSSKKQECLLEQWNELNIMLIHTETNPFKIRRLFKSGIKGYISPNTPPDQILEGTQQISQGQTYVSPFVQQTIWQFSGANKMIKKSVSQKLTKRETQVLKLIVEEYSTREIADHLFIAFCTVETHRKNLIAKLGVKNTAGLVREAIRLRIYTMPALYP